MRTVSEDNQTHIATNSPLYVSTVLFFAVI